MSSLKHRWKLLIGVTLVATLGAALGVGVASAAFTDTAGSPFATEIDNIANAGCASGFPDGSYRPTEPVNRQQMAAFINRCAGRVAHANGTTVTLNAAGGFTDLVTTTITPGGITGATTNFLDLHGSAHAATSDDGDCPCDMELRIVTDSGTCAVSSTRATDLVGAGDDSAARTTFAVGHGCAVSAGVPVTVKLQARYVDSNVSGVVALGELTAVSAPFAGDGDNTL